MTQLDAFLQAVKDDPDDDAPRLLLADWLEDQGDPRGEFIRVQCLRARLPGRDPRNRVLVDREAVLLAEHGAAWLGPWVIEPWMIGGESRFRRGLLEVGLAAEDLWAASAFTEEAFAWVESLRLWSRTFPIIDRLAKASFLNRLSALDLSNNRYIDLAALTDCPNVANLRKLRLSANPLGRTGASQIAGTPYLARLKVLELSSTRLGDEGVLALTASPHLMELASLNLAYNEITDAGAAALARWAGLNRLTSLFLKGNLIGSDGAKALASSPHLGRLEILDLEENRVGAKGAAALASSTCLPRLVNFNWESNPIGTAQVAALRRRFRMTSDPAT